MSDPHFNDERIVEREVVERPVTERIVERPARGRIVSETRTGMGGMGTNPVALILAGVLAVFIIVLIFGYLL